MKTLDDVLKAVIDHGAKFTIDFKRRTLKVDGKYVIGKERTIEMPPALTTAEFIEELEARYENYKYSVPSERSENRSRLYFKALPEAELSDEQMLYGDRRETARVYLETLCLTQILGGWQWPEELGKWFWQSSQDKDLILLREWFEAK